MRPSLDLMIIYHIKCLQIEPWETVPQKKEPWEIIEKITQNWCLHSPALIQIDQCIIVNLLFLESILRKLVNARKLRDGQELLVVKRNYSKTNFELVGVDQYYCCLLIGDHNMVD